MEQHSHGTATAGQQRDASEPSLLVVASRDPSAGAPAAGPAADVFHGSVLNLSSRHAVDRVWSRLHAHLEGQLATVEGFTAQLMLRPLGDREERRLREATRVVAAELSGLAMQNASEIAGRIEVAIDRLGARGGGHAECGLGVASLLDDLRVSIAVTVDDVRLQAPQDQVVAVVGEESDLADRLVWVAALARLKVVRSSTARLLDLGPVAATLVVDPVGPLPRMRALLRSVREADAVVPVAVVGPPVELGDQARFADSVDLLLDSGQSAVEIMEAIRRLLARAELRSSVGVYGSSASTVASYLGERRLLARAVGSIGELFEGITAGELRSVVVVDDGTRDLEVLRLLNLLRTNRGSQRTPVVRLTAGEPDRSRARVASALRAGADAVVDVADGPDVLAQTLGALLRRRADWESHVREPGKRAVPWTSARQVIERMLMAAFRSGAQVSIAVVYSPPGTAQRSDDDLAAEFRAGDVLTRVSDDEILVALHNASAELTVRRLGSVLERRDPSKATDRAEVARQRAGVAEFPYDGRTLDDLLASARDAIARSEAAEGPRSVGAGWWPESADVPDVMLVDPDEMLGSILRSSLARRGLRLVQSIESGDALDLLTGFRRGALPRCVLVELNLLGMDGFQFLTALRDAGTTHRVPVVVVSARASESDIKRAFDLGAEGFIAKPISSVLLEHTLERMLKVPVS